MSLKVGSNAFLVGKSGEYVSPATNALPEEAPTDVYIITAYKR
jgi:hypothetical protein